MAFQSYRTISIIKRNRLHFAENNDILDALIELYSVQKIEFVEMDLLKTATMRR